MTRLTCLLLLLLAPTLCWAQTGPALPEVQDAELGSTKNCFQCGPLYLTGQFTQKDIAELKKAGITKVISLRMPSEVDWDEEAELKKAGIEFLNLPIGRPDAFNDKLFDTVRECCQSDSCVMLHCGSAVRVSAAWLPYRVLDQGVELDKALEEARKVGLKVKFMETKAVEYIKKQQEKQQEKEKEVPQTTPRPAVQQAESSADAKQSVKPGINKSFLDPELDVDQYVERFEIESREVYSGRHKILQACDIEPGDIVADVGAGTGLFTRLFAIEVGENGWVYAVDIAPRFLKHIQETAAKENRSNITGVLCTEDSVTLPANSVDVVFICDTYHHFEYPDATMKSIHRALKNDGHLIMIDFHRIEGKTREWLLDHVRAGKETFQSEIMAAGFELVEEKQIPGFEENYFLKFKKKS